MSDQPTSRYMESKKIQNAQRDLLRAIDEYKAILKDSVHPQNQNPTYKKREQHALDHMIKGASDLDSLMEEPGAGIFGLISLLFRSNLYLKNELVKVRREMKQNEIKLMKLQANARGAKKRIKNKGK